jgi:hypothetical protein
MFNIIDKYLSVIIKWQSPEKNLKNYIQIQFFIN